MRPRVVSSPATAVETSAEALADIASTADSPPSALGRKGISVARYEQRGRRPARQRPIAQPAQARTTAAAMPSPTASAKRDGAAIAAKPAHRTPSIKRKTSATK